MKKYIISMLLSILTLPAIAQIGLQYDMAYKQFASSFTFQDVVVPMPTSGQCVSMLNADLTAKAPICAVMGTGLSFDSASKTLNITIPTQVNSDWNASSG